MVKKVDKEIKGIVYKVVSPSNKVYIGITITTLNERKRTHLKDVIKGSKRSFHNAIRKYGNENMVWEIIDNENDFEKLKKLEIKYIKKFNSYQNGYNQTKGGEGTFGLKHTKQQIENNSKRRKEFFKNEENKNILSKSVAKTLKENPHILEQHSLRMKKRFEVEKNREIASKSMVKYLGDKENRLNHAIQRGAKPFIVKKDDVTIGEWTIQSECAKELNLSKSHINKCLKGGRKTHKGYTFSFL